MKCPHCNIGIHGGFSAGQFLVETQVMSKDGETLAPQGSWNFYHLRCPECHEAVIYLQHIVDGRISQGQFMAYPKGYSRPVSPEVVEPYKSDFVEACRVLLDSPKASAALSRRCLQAVLKDKAGARKRDLADQIDEVIGSGVPSYIAEGLHAVRNIGNFAAPPLKSTN